MPASSPGKAPLPSVSNPTQGKGTGVWPVPYTPGKPGKRETPPAMCQHNTACKCTYQSVTPLTTTADGWNGKHWIRDSTRALHYARSQECCMYCVSRIPGGAFAHVSLGPDGEGKRSLDHLIPREQGGSNHWTNIVPCHATCNSQRGKRPWRGYLRERYAADPERAAWAIRRITIVAARPLKKPARPTRPSSVAQKENAR